MAEIYHGVELPGGAISNTIGHREVIEQMYPAWQEGSQVADSARTERDVDQTAVRVRSFNSSLRFEEIDSRLAILGNTKTGTCPVAEDCGSCALAGAGISTAEMSDRNCAVANTAESFQEIDQAPEGRFMLLPTSSAAYVVDETKLTGEYNGGELLQNRLDSASSVVFTRSWIEDQGLDKISIAMNGADGSFGIATTEINGEVLCIAFCSMRPNMGDRPEDKQIIRQALNAYFDSQNTPEEERSELSATMRISVDLSASASLAHFAHKVQIPDDDTKYAVTLREKYPDLIGQANGKITPRIVLHDQYAGALERGNIYRQSDAWLGEQSSDPYSPTACPLEGETCHVDYREETKYSIMRQLTQMGVPPENIDYHDESALDPANPNNNMASNRAEQNNGVAVKMTNRTLNGMTIELRDLEMEAKEAFNQAASVLAVDRIVALPLSDGMPDIDPVDPFVSLYEVHTRQHAPPRELWDTPENKQAAYEDGGRMMHPMTYWLMSSDIPDDPELRRLYDEWMRQKSNWPN